VKRVRDNRLFPSAAQRRRWAHLPGFMPHDDVTSTDADSWTGLPAEYRHATEADVAPLRAAAATSLLTVWTVDPAAPRAGMVHLNRYTMTVAQALDLIGGAARGRWVEQVVHIEALAPRETS
jgi:hypothetical protein